MLKRVGGLILCAFSVLATSSCSNDNAGNTGDSRKTVIVTMTSQAPAEQSPAEQPQIAEQAVAGEQSAPAPVAPAQAAPAVQAKSQVQNSGKVGGDCGVSSQGDKIHAYPASSCDFAWAIYDQALSLTYYIGRSGTSRLPHADDVEIISPTTGQTYPIHCWIGSDGFTLICQQDGTTNTVGASFTKDAPPFTPPKWSDRLNVVHS